MASRKNNTQAESSQAALERKERKRIRKKWHRGTFGHVLAVIFLLLAGLVALVVMVLGQFFLGSSQAASDSVVQTLHQSSALKFVPYLYLYEHVAESLERGNIVSGDEVTDASLITVAARQPRPENAEEEEQFDENGILLKEINGATYHGYMMIVQDPSRVVVGVCNYNPSTGTATRFSTERAGKRVDEIMQLYGGIACINAGAFSDPNGSGNGGMAEGLVISQGVTMKGNSKTYSAVAGFDENDILHVGNFTKAQAEEMGLRDACAFGPTLIVNGKASLSKDTGLNPRTAIGQRADGAVLMLVIDGRQANSMGATIGDVINIMLEYGAVNACNMDGGSSTIMYYGSEKINDGMTVSVSRRMPTAWIVLQGDKANEQ